MVKSRRENGIDYIVGGAGIAVALAVAGIGFLSEADSPLVGIVILAVAALLGGGFFIGGVVAVVTGEDS